MHLASQQKECFASKVQYDSWKRSRVILTNTSTTISRWRTLVCHTCFLENVLAPSLTHGFWNWNRRSRIHINRLSQHQFNFSVLFNPPSCLSVAPGCRALTSTLTRSLKCWAWNLKREDHRGAKRGEWLVQHMILSRRLETLKIAVVHYANSKNSLIYHQTEEGFTVFTFVKNGPAFLVEYTSTYVCLSMFSTSYGSPAYVLPS